MIKAELSVVWAKMENKSSSLFLERKKKRMRGMCFKVKRHSFYIIGKIQSMYHINKEKEYRKWHIISIECRP